MAGDVKLPEDLQARKHAAEVAKAEAEARKSAADALTAEATAMKASVEAASAEGSQVSPQQRDAEARKAIAVADKDAAAARREQLSALIPDVGAVKASTLEVKDGPALFASSLAFGALQHVAAAIRTEIVACRLPRCRMLITSEADLASDDAIYQTVKNGLAQLEKAAERLIKDVTAPSVKTAAFAGPAAVIAALSGAVPGVLSLLSAKRTLTTAAVSVSDLAAKAAVAGALRKAPETGIALVFDDLRLIPASGVYDASDRVSEQRQQLVAQKIVFEDQKGTADANLTAALAREKILAKESADAGTTPRSDVALQLETVRKEITSYKRQIAGVALRIGLLESLLTSIATFTAAITVVPEGGRRSALATAALYEQLHSSSVESSSQAKQTSAGISHVLLIKAQPGQSQHLLNDKPLWFEDKFSTIVDVSVTYVLISTQDSSVVSAGTVTRSAKVYGTIGDEPTVKIDS